MTSGIDGNRGVGLALVVWLAMSLLAFGWSMPGMVPDLGAGICLPPPSAWPLIPWVSWLLNAACILLTGLAMVDLNRRYNFIPAPTLIYLSAFLVIAGANPWTSGHLNASSLLAAANAIAISLLVRRYGRPGAPTEMFIIASLFSLGTMFHFAFIFFIVVYAFSAMILKLFGWKECAAMVMGVIAPYWILLGTGLVAPESLRIPRVGSLWAAAPPSPDRVFALVLAGITALWTLILALRNAATIYSAGTAPRSFNHALMLPTLTSVILLFVDYENFMVYYVSLSLFAALATGYLVLRNSSRIPRQAYWTIMVAYLIMFVIIYLNGQFA